MKQSNQLLTFLSASCLMLFFIPSILHGQEIDTNVGDNGVFEIIQNEVDYAIFYNNTFACLKDYELTHYNSSSEINENFGINGLIEHIFRISPNYNSSITKIIVEQNNAYFIGSAFDTEKGNSQGKIAKINLSNNGYDQFFGNQGIKDINIEGNGYESIFGGLVFQDTLRIWGGKETENSKLSFYMDFDKEGNNLLNNNGKKYSGIEKSNLFVKLLVKQNHLNHIFYSYQNTEGFIPYLDINESVNLTEEYYNDNVEPIENDIPNPFYSYGNTSFEIIDNKLVSATNGFNECESFTSIFDLENKNFIPFNPEVLELPHRIIATHVVGDKIINSGQLTDNHLHPFFMYAVNLDGELISTFGNNGIFFLDVGNFSEEAFLDNTFLNNERLIFSINDPFISNYLIPVKLDLLLEAPKKSIEDILLHPNPTFSHISLTDEFLEEINTIIIYSIDGKKVLQTSHDYSTTMELKVDDLEAAPYVISFYKDQELIHSEKFIKVK